MADLSRPVMSWTARGVARVSELKSLLRIRGVPDASSIVRVKGKPGSFGMSTVLLDQDVHGKLNSYRGHR